MKLLRAKNDQGKVHINLTWTFWGEFSTKISTICYNDTNASLLKFRICGI